MASNAALFRRAKPSGHSAAARSFVAARAVGSYVPKLTHKAFEKYGFAAAALVTDWPVIVGKEIAAYTAPERLKWPRGVGFGDEVGDDDAGRPGATLIVRVEPARALDIQYRGQQLLERINGHFGYRAVAELRILQAPLPERTATRAMPPSADAKPVAAPELDAIGDERLRAALASLKSGLMGRGRGA